MNNEPIEYTISVFTEDQTGMLSRVVSIFNRRHINIESLTVSKSSIPDIYRFTIVVELNEDTVKKLVGQIEKQVDILKSFYYNNQEIIYQEIALYKVPLHVFTDGLKGEKLVREHNAKILEINREFVVIEKTGHQHETDALLKEFEQLGIYGFVRSGRVAIVKPMEELNNYLSFMDQVKSNPELAERAQEWFGRVN